MANAEIEEDTFKVFWESLKEGKFPASPMDSSLCEYCPVNTVCYGYQNEFFPFLELERKEIIEKSQKQFPKKWDKTERIVIENSKKKGI